MHSGPPRCSRADPVALPDPSPTKFSYTITTSTALDETALRDLLEGLGVDPCEISRTRLGVGAPPGPRARPEASLQLGLDLPLEPAAPAPQAGPLRSTKAIAAAIVLQLQGRDQIDKATLFQLSGAAQRPTFQKALEGLVARGDIRRVGWGQYALGAQQAPPEASDYTLPLLELPEAAPLPPGPTAWDGEGPRLRLVSSR